MPVRTNEVNSFRFFLFFASPNRSGIFYDKTWSVRFNNYNQITLVLNSASFIVFTLTASVNFSCAQPPPLRATAGHLPAFSVPKMGHLQILRRPGPDICQTWGYSRAFDMHAVSYKYTEDITGKKADWLICPGQGVVKACSRFYACISSLLIKPELHSEIGAIDVNQRFLVIESNFCWYYLKNILSYL